MPNNKLEYQDTLLNVMFENATVGIVMADEEGAIIRCNPYATQMFGYKLDELIDQSIEILIPNIFYADHLDHIKSVPNNTVPRDLGVRRELLAKRIDGRQIPVEVSLSYGQDGKNKIVIALVNDITNHIEKEKELIIKSEAIAFATIPICFADLEGRITYANPAFVKLWGFEKEEDVIGKSNMELGNSPEKVKKIMTGMNEAGSWTGYDKAKRIDGTPFDVFLTTSLVRNAGGIPICTIATFMDITELKQTQQVLEEKSQTLRSSMQLAKLGSWQFELSTNTVFLDEQTLEIFGLPADEKNLAYDEFIALYLPEDQQDIIDKLQHAIETKSSCEKECSILVGNNEPRWIASEAQALLNEDGKVIKLMGVSHDITKRIETEVSNRDISKIIEESLNEIFIFEAESLKFVQVNKGARQNLRYTLEELQFLTADEIKPEFTKDSFLRHIRPLVNGEKELLKFQTVHLRKDKTTYPVEVHLQYSRLSNQPVFIAYILDITERIKAEQQLLVYSNQLEQKVAERTNELAKSQIKIEKALIKEQELNELKSNFVSMASHEFRTPLTSIIFSSDLIKMHLEGGNFDKYPKHLKNINSAVNNLTSILNDFLSLEKLESGEVQFNPEPIDLNEFVLSIVEEVNLLATGNQTINYIHSGDEKANIDQQLVRNLIINLLSNAIKYSPNGEDVELNLERKAKSLVIRVKDNGIGIPDDEQQKMFSRFFRASNVSTIQGTGIGLTIVKRYLDIMKGSISFESKVNLGTIFIVEIPQ